MAILAYQLFIVFSLLVVRLVAPRHLLTACLIWSGFTIFNLFFWPLILVQLAVVWVTFSVLQPKEIEKPAPATKKADSPPPPRPAPAATASPPAIRADAPSILTSVHKAVTDFNRSIDRASALQQASYRIERVMHAEKLRIETALTMARQNIQLEAFFAEAPGNRASYENTVADISRLREKSGAKGEAVESERDPDVPDFSLPPRHADSETADAIAHRIGQLQQQREAFLVDLKLSLDRDGVLREQFFRVMEASTHRKIWAALQQRLRPRVAPASKTLAEIFKAVEAARPKQTEPPAPPARKTPQQAAELILRPGIHALAAQLGIRHLVHFTRVKNLPSIMRHGLLSVEAADRRGIQKLANDPLRLDGHLDAVSLSIEFPNALMFYKYRQLHPDDRWVVLLLKPEILWNHNCAFCTHNAADRRIRSRTWPELSAEPSFRSMFKEAPADSPPRSTQGLGPADPTDAQAEILVRGDIPPSMVVEMVFEHPDDMEAHSHITACRSTLMKTAGHGYFGTRRFVRQIGRAA